MSISDNNVDYFRNTGTVLGLGLNDASLDIANLGILTTSQTTSFGQTISLSNNGDDNILRVGEAFTMTRDPLVGSTRVTELTLVGTGTLTPLLGGSRSFIIAQSNTTPSQQYVIFPNGDLPVVSGSLVATISTQEAGFNFTTNAPVCFARGTMLQTDTGPRPIEELKAGDMVQTKDRGLQPISWIGSRAISARQLQASPHLRPICIAKGALGDGVPSADLVVSPQHRVLVRSKIAQKMFGTQEVLVAAKQLLQVNGVDIMDVSDAGVEYYHVLFAQHEIVLSNGAETESLYTGAEALKTISKSARAEIFNLFPELQDADYQAIGARALVSGRKGRALATRHAKHNRYLVM